MCMSILSTLHKTGQEINIKCLSKTLITKQEGIENYSGLYSNGKFHEFWSERKFYSFYSKNFIQTESIYKLNFYFTD